MANDDEDDQATLFLGTEQLLYLVRTHLDKEDENVNFLIDYANNLGQMSGQFADPNIQGAMIDKITPSLLVKLRHILRFFVMDQSDTCLAQAYATKTNQDWNVAAAVSFLGKDVVLPQAQGPRLIRPLVPTKINPITGRPNQSWLEWLDSIPEHDAVPFYIEIPIASRLNIFDFNAICDVIANAFQAMVKTTVDMETNEEPEQMEEIERPPQEGYYDEQGYYHEPEEEQPFEADQYQGTTYQFGSDPYGDANQNDYAAVHEMQSGRQSSAMESYQDDVEY